MERLIRDAAVSEGMKNVLRRAAQLSEIRWTPVRPLPAIVSDAQSGSKPHLFLPAWRPRRGVGYSAVRYDEKYVGSNVPLYTYLTALSDPQSVMYTRPLLGRNVLGAAFYGCVCSQFVSYAFDLPFQIDCSQWPELPGIREICPEPLEELRLCDVLNDPKRHTALITGISRTEDGAVARITVSEATPPAVRVTTFTALEFREFWLAKGEYQVLRFDDLDRVGYTPDPCIPLLGDPEMPAPFINREIMPDYGDRANYALGEPVAFHVPGDRYSRVTVRQVGETIAVLPCAGERAAFRPDRPGFYEAMAESDEGASAPVFFCVTDAGACLAKPVYHADEPVRPAFSCAAGDPLAGWVVKTREFAKVRGFPADREGNVPTEALLPAGQYLLIGLYRNEYGTYMTRPCWFDVRG